MVLKGEAGSAEEAFALMKAHRAAVGIQPQQRAVLLAAEALLQRRAGAAATSL